MRLKKQIIAEIGEYLRLHYIEEKPILPAARRRFKPFGKDSAARGLYREDSSVLMDECEDGLSLPDESEDKLPELDEREPKPCSAPEPRQNAAPRYRANMPAPQYQAPMPTAAYGDLSERLNTLDESFQEALLRLIDERGMKDSACYKRAGVDRKLFSKIRSNPSYRPSKATAVAFAIALELNLDETVDLLRKAGYALSHSSKFDVIVEYFIVKGRFSLRELNEALYEFDQPLVNG